MKRPWMLSRRTFLRSAGTLIALPSLDSMAPALAHAQAMGKRPPRRLLAWFAPNGVNMAEWTPANTGPDFTWTRILRPLAPLKDHVLVLSGLANRPGQPDSSGDHAAGVGAFLTAKHVKKTEGAGLENGISMDQVVAKAIGAETRFPSLQLGTEAGGSAGTCDAGYSCAYARNISWAGPATPLAKEVTPRAVFDRLFRGQDAGATASEMALRRLHRKSVLDFVLEDARQLQKKLGTRDQRKLDEYTTGLRELERRIEREDEGHCPAPERPEETTNFESTLRMMSDLMVLAFQCDLTRVISFMMGNGLSPRVYTSLGLREGHHQLSHHQNNPEILEMLNRIDVFRISELAYLLERLKAIEEPGGTMLDQTIVYYSSDVGDGNTHTHTHLPVLLAGRGGGKIRTGRHLRYESEQPMASLFLSIIHAFDVEVPRFGDDGVAPLPDLG